MRFGLVGWGLRFWLLGLEKDGAMAPDEALALGPGPGRGGPGRARWVVRS